MGHYIDLDSVTCRFLKLVDIYHKVPFIFYDFVACNASGPTHQQNLMGIDSPPGHQISVGGGDSVSPLGTQHVQYTGPVFNGSVSLIQSANIQTLNMSSPGKYYS